MFQFNEYEKIERTLLSPARELQLKNVVLLGKKSRNDEKLEPHYSKKYNSKKYSNYDSLRTIQIDTRDYLVLTYSYKKDFQEIYMSYPHIPNFIGKLRLAQQIMKNELKQGDEKAEVFIEEDGELFLNTRYKELELTIDGLINDTVILINFDVIVHDREGLNESRGIIMYINDTGYGIEITEKMLDGLVYFLDGFNLLTSSELIYNTALLTLNSHNATSDSPNVSEGKRNPKSLKSKVSKNKVGKKFNPRKIAKNKNKSITDMFSSEETEVQASAEEVSDQDIPIDMTDHDSTEDDNTDDESYIEDIPEWSRTDEEQKKLDEKKKASADVEEKSPDITEMSSRTTEENSLKNILKHNPESDTTSTIVNMNSIIEYSE